MKKYPINCDFADQKAQFNCYVGETFEGVHPLAQQAAWLLRERGGVIPPEVMESFRKLAEIARENNVSFEELCEYALNSASSPQPEASEQGQG